MCVWSCCIWVHLNTRGTSWTKSTTTIATETSAPVFNWHTQSKWPITQTSTSNIYIHFFPSSRIRVRARYLISALPKVIIGAMDNECPHCHALKFKHESVGMCCPPGKVQLPEIETPPEPFNGLLIGTDPVSNLFLKSIRTFNLCFQITFFGVTEMVHNTVTIQFNVQNQRPSVSRIGLIAANAKRTTYIFTNLLYGR